MYKFFKRLEDITIALSVLILGSPVLLIVGLILYFSGVRPIFFKQIRSGKNGNPFKIYKFRSMRDTLDENGVLLPDEQRVTAIGKFIRKTSLDELPQMINVLRGEMSIVGPRPLLVEYNQMYSSKHRHRLDVLPGITGYAAVQGRSSLVFSKRFDLDVEYVKKASFWLDNLIIIKTFFAVFIAKGSPEVLSYKEYDDLGFVEKVKEIRAKH